MLRLFSLLIVFMSAAISLFAGDVVKDAWDYGFRPENTAWDNHRAFQQALSGGGTIVVSVPGTYDLSNTNIISSDTELLFSEGVRINKCADENGILPTYLFVNEGAFDRTYDENITIEGLDLDIKRLNMGSDVEPVVGLQATLSFFYVRNLKMSDIVINNVGYGNFALQVCTFEDITLENIHIDGDKDGIHLGRGRRFAVRNCTMRTYDDPIALNAHDYMISNPELGWIEDGVIENCVDLQDSETTGFFCRVLAGGWREWESGMELQNSDAVISQGRIYRVEGEADGKLYVSQFRPQHLQGVKDYGDGISWVMTQSHDVTDNCGVRNVLFKDIVLEKDRPAAFCITFDNSEWSRGYYPLSTVPVQGKFVFDGIEQKAKIQTLISCQTPVDTLIIKNSRIKDANIMFHHQKTPGLVYRPVYVELNNVTFDSDKDKYYLFGNPDGLEVNVNFVNCHTTRDDIEVIAYGVNVLSSGISSPRWDDFRVFAANGAVCVELEREADVTVTDIAGRCLYRGTFSPGTHVVRSMEPGVYIVNGRKVMVL